ncbi:hypothetical protein [Speluncibacter jeojiensis]|uniref:Uncharacterized protein n=1 Tax=Speluncibacter jeojiensis TaxID=2710754 RepID=A0A9X4RCG2_9ACTN|nr:hypothetical protein [Corynebacteriales bacterium D3-21]
MFVARLAKSTFPLGIYLTANQTINPYAEAALSPIAALPSDAATPISGSNIVMPWAANGTVTFTCPSAFPNNSTSLVIEVNGTQVASATSSPVTWTGALHTGGTVTALVNHNNGGTFTITAGTANTYMTVTPS